MADSLARVTTEVISRDEVQDFVLRDLDGALVVFEGIIRNHDGGNDVFKLDYEAHPDAQSFLSEVCEEIASKHDLRVAAVHRVGTLEVGDVALVAAVSSPHRREAFVACEELIELIKERTPIWKRQHRSDGVTEWVNL